MAAKNLVLAVMLFMAGVASGQEIAPKERAFVSRLMTLRCAMEKGAGPWPGYLLGAAGAVAVNLPQSRISVLFAAETPPGFKPVYGELARQACGAAAGGIYYKSGRLGGMERNFSNEKISGQEIFIFNLTLENDAVSSVSQLRLFAHEYFHKMQNSWLDKASVGEPLFSDIDAGTYAWMLIEDTLLAKALMADETQLKGIAREFIRVRGYRQKRQPDLLTAWDDQQEGREGTALYQELRAEDIANGDGSGFAPWRLPEVLSRLLKGSSGLDMNYLRERYYVTGAAEGIILDRLGIKWKRRVMNGESLFSVLKGAVAFSWLPEPGWYLKRECGYGEWLTYVSEELAGARGRDRRALREFRAGTGPRLEILTPYLVKAGTVLSHPVLVPGKNPGELDRLYRTVVSFEVRRAGEFDVLVKDAQLLLGYNGEKLKQGRFTWDGMYGEFLFPEGEKIRVEADGKRIAASWRGEIRFKKLNIRSSRAAINLHTPGLLVREGQKYSLTIDFPPPGK